MSTNKWLDMAVGICLVMIIAVVTVYSFESGGTASVIPVTGSQEIPITLCCLRTHEKVHPVTQPIQGETNESASPGSP